MTFSIPQTKSNLKLVGLININTRKDDQNNLKHTNTSSLFGKTSDNCTQERDTQCEIIYTSNGNISSLFETTIIIYSVSTRDRIYYFIIQSTFYSLVSFNI